MSNFNSREVVEKLSDILNMHDHVRPGSDRLKHAASILDSALLAANPGAAERFCAMCPGNGLEECEWDNCSDRAAILGREVGKPGNDQTCEYCRGTGVISDSIALTKPCPMCSTKQSALKGEEAPHE